ncbi:putative aminotransferase [Candida tropicalis]
MTQFTDSELQNSKLIHRSITKPPTVLIKAKGQYVYSQDGKKYLDAIGGAAVISVGHNNPEVIESIHSHMLNNITYSFNADFTIPIVENFANLLLDGYDDKIAKVYFANSGSEANENAIKLAIQYWIEMKKPTKNQFISRGMSYHGNCLGGISLSGNKARVLTYEEIIDSKRFHKVSPCYEFRYKKEGETSEEYTQRLLDELEEKITEVGPENIAAFFAETIVGATTGCVPPTPGYFKGVREICDKYDILLILDEVMCGSGRTGTFFAWEQEGITPDITTSGKTISGGYCPLSCVFINQRILDRLISGSGIHNTVHTFQNFSISCVAGYTVQKIIKRENLLQNVTKMGNYFEKQLIEKVLNKFDIVVDIRGRGLFWGVEFAIDKESKEPFESDLNVGYKIGDLIKKHGVIGYPGKGTIDGYKGDHILFAPSFDITGQEIDIIVEALSSAIQDFQQEYM